MATVVRNCEQNHSAGGQYGDVVVGDGSWSIVHCEAVTVVVLQWPCWRMPKVATAVGLGKLRKCGRKSQKIGANARANVAKPDLATWCDLNIKQLVDLVRLKLNLTYRGNQVV